MRKLFIILASVFLLQSKINAQCISINTSIQFLKPTFQGGASGTLSGLAAGNYFYQLTRTGDFTTSNLIIAVNTIAWVEGAGHMLTINAGSSSFLISGNAIGAACGVHEDVQMDIFNISGQKVCSTTFHFSKPNSTITGPSALCTTSPGNYSVNPVPTGGTYVWSSSASGWKINGSTSPVTTGNSITLQSPFAGAPTTNLCVSSSSMCQSTCFAIAGGVSTSEIMNYTDMPCSSFSIDFTAPASSSVQTSSKSTGPWSSVSSYIVIYPRTRTVYARAINSCGASAVNSYFMGASTSCGRSGVMNNKIAEKIEMNLFPNPSNGQMQLNYTLEKAQQGELQIMDMLGKKVSSYKLTEGENTLSINETELKDGIYLYRVIINNELVKADELSIVH